MEDWDLQAIVKGCSGRPTSMLQDPFFSFLSEEDDFSCDFSSSSSCSSHEFEGFGSSIFPVFHPLIPYPNNSAAISDLLGEFKEPQKLLQKKQISATKQKQRWVLQFPCSSSSSFFFFFLSRITDLQNCMILSTKII